MELKQKTGIKGTVVEYVLKFSRDEAKDYCEYPMNQITFRLYKKPIEKGTILYYNAGVGYTKDTFAVDLSADPCPKKIRIGIDKQYVFNENYIIMLICNLLRQQDFTSGKINLEDGIYTFSTGEKTKAGDYVGTGFTIVEDKKVKFQKRF